MGIFTVICDKCGNKVSKRARFCNNCGAPTPGGWWKCPGCGKWVGNDVEYCSHCNTRLYPDDRVTMAGGVWQKAPEKFAERFEVGDLKLADGQTLQVQEGTSAILMDGGEVKHVLSSGIHGMDGMLRKINWFGAPPPRSVVMIDSGEVVVPLRMENLRTAEFYPIEFYGEAILQFAGGTAAAHAFVANVLKESRECLFSDLVERIEPSIRSAVDELCTTSTVEELVRDPARRIRLRERMEARLKEDLGACGLEVVRVSSAEFTGEEYEEWASKQGKLEEQRRDEEYRAALRSMMNKEQMGAFRDSHALAEYKATIDAEWRVSQATREREFEELKKEWAHDDAVRQRLDEVEQLEHDQELQVRRQEHRHGVEDREQDHRLAQDAREVDHKVTTGQKIDAYEREKLVEDAGASVKAQKLHSEQDVADATEWLKVKKQKQALELEAKAAEAERRSRMGIEYLLADIEDPQARDQLIKLFHLKLQAGMTPQQILATLGKSDHDLSEEYKKYLEKMEALYQDASNRADKNFSRVVDPLRVDVLGKIIRGESGDTQKVEQDYREDRHSQQEIPSSHEHRD